MIRRTGKHHDRFRLARCRAEGCRTRTRSVYSLVIAPGQTIRVHLCDRHHHFELKYGAHALALKPVHPERRATRDLYSAALELGMDGLVADMREAHPWLR